MARGRVRPRIRNRFLERWAESRGRTPNLGDRTSRRIPLLGPDAETAEKAIWAGEAASFVTDIESAADVLRHLVADAAKILTTRPATLLR